MTRLPALLLLFAFNAQAYTGQDLLADCQAAETLHNEKKLDDASRSARAARCLGYVEGFAEGYEVADYLAGKVELQLNAFCLPAGEDRPYRLVRAVLAHLERQPPNATASPRTLVAGALARAFPCGQ